MILIVIIINISTLSNFKIKNFKFINFVVTFF